MLWFRCGYSDDEFTGFVLAENEDHAIERYKKHIKEKLSSDTLWDQLDQELFWGSQNDEDRMVVIV